MYLKMLSVKWQPFCLGFNLLTLLALSGHYNMIDIYSIHDIWKWGNKNGTK